jgi:hypothetical protein
MRARPPRYIDAANKVACAYSIHKAMGALMVNEGFNGAYQHDYYIDHIPEINKDGTRTIVFLVKRVLVIEFKKAAREYIVVQEIDSASIVSRVLCDNGTELRMADSGSQFIAIDSHAKLDEVNALLSNYINIIHERPQTKVG